MPDTIREKIVQAFAAKVGAIRCVHLDSDSELPAKSVWDNAEETEKTPYGKLKITLPLSVDYLAKIDSTNFSNLSAQANAMLGELIQAATSGDNSLTGLCQSITYMQCQFVYPQDGASEIEVLSVFNLVYLVNIGDPYSQ